MEQLKQGPIAVTIAVAVGGLALAGSVLAALSKPRSVAPVPEKMKAVRLVSYIEGDISNHFEYVDIPTPEPRPGQVLVRIERSPINPSDLSSLQGTYNSAQREALPSQCGFEASGTVVKSGGGLLGWRVLGKRVACASTAGGRTWAEYALVPAAQAVPLPADVTFEEGCSVFVNPLTCAAFVEIAQAGGHKAVLHTAAASALGKMFVRYGQHHGLEIINIVRKTAQKEALLALGAKHVINSSDDGWETELAAKCRELNCRLGFDAVAGSLTGAILRNMPPKSTLRVYGGLSREHVSDVRPTDLIFAGKTVAGFWLTPYLMTKSLLGKKRMIDKVMASLKTDLRTDFGARFAFADVAKAIAAYNENMNVKVCLGPSV